MSFSQKGEHSTTSERFSLVNRVLSFGNTYFINRCYIKKSDFVRLLQFQSNDTIMTMFDKKSKEKDKKPKVIYTKYSKHWPYTVAHTLDCVCSKMLNHGLNHGFFLSLFKLISCPIHWIVCVLAYLKFIFEFWSSFSAVQNGRLCPDT